MSVGRNAVLIAFSAELVFAGPQRDSQGFSGFAMPGSGMALALVVAVVLSVGVGLAIWLGLQVLRQNGRLLMRIESLEREMATVKGPRANSGPRAGLPTGLRAPSFHLPSLNGETVTLEDLLASGKSLLLTFVDPGCGPCQSLVPDLERWHRELGKKLTFALLSRGKPAENRRKFSFDHTRVLLQKEREVAELYQCTGTPGAVLISPAGYVQSELATGAEGIRKLVDLVAHNGHVVHDGQVTGSGSATARGKLTPQHAVGVGQPVPAFSLLDLEGRAMTEASLHGSPTLLVFWSPNCGFCVNMLEDIRQLEAARDDLQPRLVFISAGTPEANKAMRLRSRILIESGFQLGPALGVSGTPSAVLVGSDGRVASTVAVGAAAVLRLARSAVGLATTTA